MEKNEFILNVLTFEEAQFVDMIDMEDYHLSITAWYPDFSHMVDQHITEWYNELEEIGLEEVQEGDMIYGGRLNKDQLMNTLERMGFRVASNPGALEPFRGGNPNQGGPNGGFNNPQWPTGIEDPRDLTDLDPADVHYDLKWDEDRKQYDLGVNTRMDVDQLKRDMQRAAEREDYEKAAKLRDVIKKILGEEIKRIKRLL